MKAVNATQLNNLWIYRIYLFIGAILYTAWVPLEIYINHNFASYLERGIVSTIYMSLCILSFKSKWIEKNLESIVALCFFMMIGHYLTEVNRNNVNAAAVEGFHIITTATLICLQSIWWMIAYLVYAYVGISMAYYGLSSPGIQWFHFIAAYTTIMTGNVLVLTLRKNLEKRLVKEHENFQLLFDKNLEGLAIISDDLRLIQTNEYFNSLFPGIQLGDPIPSCVEFKNQPVFEIVYIHPERGDEIILQFKVRQIEFSGAKAKLISVSDLTAKKREELSLMNSSKMAALGEMAGGIAHEVNNPLAVIRGYSDLLRRVKIDNDVSKAKVLSLSESISRTVDRIAKIISGLRRFARDGTSDTFERKNVSELLDEVLQFGFEKIKQDNIELILNVDKELDMDCQAIQMQQVLINLVNNAHYELKNLQQESKWIRIEASEFEAGWVRISIEDNGSGIPKELQQKIMQPFFTTKPVGAGTGLGLSISKGIINTHKGRFYLDEHSSGAKFIIELPRFQHQLNNDFENAS